MMQKGVLAACLSALAWPVLADVQYSGTAGVEQRYFLQDAAYVGQPRAQASVWLLPELYTSWNDGNDSLTFKPFMRADAEDSERTHADIRELMWVHVGENWESHVGIGKVFWGQTESLHLVDVINQTDSVEAVDGEDKLGQPMIKLSWSFDSGSLTGFVLPYFRERTFAGVDGRLRPVVPIDSDNAIYESEDEQSNIDFALRWQQSIGDWDIGVSYFDGTNREPLLIPNIDMPSGNVTIQPYYEQIQQVGVDLLMVNGAWLYKFESIFRQSDSQEFYAAVGGFEYTSVGVFDSVYDIGWLMEYQYDERDNSFFAPAQNDLMAGVRWVLNDVDGTEILFGYIQDLDTTSTYSAFVEASSRMTDNWRWRIDGYFFSADEQTDPYYFVRRDDHIQLSLEYYF